MKAELKSFVLWAIGEAAFGAGAAGAGAGAAAEADDHPPKSSLLNRSGAIDAAGFEAGAGAGLGGGGEAGVAFCVKEKSRPPLLCGAGPGLGKFGLVGVASKKLPPLSGGGEVTWALEGIDLVGMAVGKLLIPENAGGGDWAGGDLAVDPLEKLRPPNASASPPNASFCCVGGDAIPPKDGCRSCVGCVAGCGFGALA